MLPRAPCTLIHLLVAQVTSNIGKDPAMLTKVHHALYQQDSHNPYQEDDHAHLPPCHAIEVPEGPRIDLIRIVLIELWSRPVSCNACVIISHQKLLILIISMGEGRCPNDLYIYLLADRGFLVSMKTIHLKRTNFFSHKYMVHLPKNFGLSPI